MPRINSHNSWSRLREVWLGDVYPASWYDHLTTDVRDVFYQLTEITQQDLSKIQTVLESFDIVVQRPTYTNIDHYLDQQENLKKPSICPRDDFVVVGNTLFYANETRPWQSTVDQYRLSPGCQVVSVNQPWFNGANVVRVGLDVIIDTDIHDTPDYFDLLPDNRVTFVKNGGHMDGCFAILKPGLILANKYFDDYEKTFPGWEIIMLDNPTYGAAPLTGYQQPYPVYNGKFWNTAVGTNRSFNEHIIQHALDWVGCYTETYFELNCLVIDEKNVAMLSENTALAETLGKHGITVHWVPFRARSFWDGAMHCLTVDIRRDSCMENFFPLKSMT